MNNIKCPSNLYVPAGVTGSNSATDQDLIIVMPAIKHKVLVGFNTEDCRAMNIDVLHEDILDQVIEGLIEDKAVLLDSTKNLSLSEKKLLVLNDGESYILNSHIKALDNTDMQYFKNLFSHLNCLTNLEFEIVEEKLHSTDTSEYKISICGIKDHVLRDSMNEVAHAFTSLGQNPTQCFIAADDEELKQDNSVLQYRQNTLGHEFLHCLGLNHPSYTSIKENKEHRSIMEDLSPIMKNCIATSYSPMKCYKLPTMPTGEDICTLNSLYGSSLNESLVCNEIAQSFVAEYPYITLEIAGSNNIDNEL